MGFKERNSDNDKVMGDERELRPPVAMPSSALWAAVSHSPPQGTNAALG